MILATALPPNWRTGYNGDRYLLLRYPDKNSDNGAHVVDSFYSRDYPQACGEECVIYTDWVGDELAILKRTVGDSFTVDTLLQLPEPEDGDWSLLDICYHASTSILVYSQIRRGSDGSRPGPRLVALSINSDDDIDTVYFHRSAGKPDISPDGSELFVDVVELLAPPEQPLIRAAIYDFHRDSLWLPAGRNYSYNTHSVTRASSSSPYYYIRLRGGSLFPSGHEVWRYDKSAGRHDLVCSVRSPESIRWAVPYVDSVVVKFESISDDGRLATRWRVVHESQW